MNTSEQYDKVIQICKDLFLKKAHDYGTSWRIMRLPSITDQIFIKAQRIRTIQEVGESKIEDNISDEFMGIINYCIIAQMQIRSLDDPNLDWDTEHTRTQYEDAVSSTKNLMLAKNHDYGEAWRQMRIESLTDLILMKLHRTKQIEDNNGKTLVSEGVLANYQDMMNYAVFAMIQLGHTD